MIAKPHIRAKKRDGSDRSFVEYVKPETVLKCTTKKQLQKYLDWYSYPFIKNRVPDEKSARRQYVEKVRPALRWYCKKFGVDVPEWLKSNGGYDKLSPEDHEQHFGKDPLDVREFQEMDGGSANAGS